MENDNPNSIHDEARKYADAFAGERSKTPPGKSVVMVMLFGGLFPVLTLSAFGVSPGRTFLPVFGLCTVVSAFIYISDVFGRKSWDKAYKEKFDSLTRATTDV